MNVSKFTIFFLLLLCSCHPRSYLLEPKICYTPQRCLVDSTPTAFDPLTQTELETEWGKELRIGIAFAKELDLYRAITTFKRALILTPQELVYRRQQTEFYIVQSYYLGNKYKEAMEAAEFSSLSHASPASFPAFHELLIILYESYLKTLQCQKAQAILDLIEKGSPTTALDLKTFTAIHEGCFSMIPTDNEDLACFINNYCHCQKSVRTAQTLNAILPGAGYYYIGQKKSALTSFALNTSFIAASYYFFSSGNWGAGLFTTSLELGWYFGGINGAGLGAKEYNQYLYNNMGKDVLIKRNLFPVLMLGTYF